MQDTEYAFSHPSKSQASEILEFWSVHAENHSRPEDSIELIHQLIDRDPEALILATSKGKIVGTVIAGWDGWRGSIYRIAVDKNLKRSGLGRKLMEHAEERLKNLGANRINAMVFEENVEAHPFYSRLGYSIQNDWRRWIKNI